MTVANIAGQQTAHAIRTATMASAATKTAQQAARTPLARRIILPAVAAVSIGAAIAMKGFTETMPAIKPRTDPRQHENQMLMDAYGAAESIEDLQKAMEHYGTK